MSIKRKMKRKKLREQVIYKHRPRQIPVVHYPRKQAKKVKDVINVNENEIEEDDDSTPVPGLTKVIQEMTSNTEERAFLDSDISRDNRVSFIMEEAQKYVGLYKYKIKNNNEESELSFDSGEFVQHVLNDTKLYNIKSSDSNEICNIFKSNYRFDPSIANVEFGDLIFFANTHGEFPDGTITHVGFFINSNTILHANSITKNVSKTNDYETYWKHYFAGIGKI